MSDFSYLREDTYSNDIDVKKVYKKHPLNKKIKTKPNQVNFNRSIFHRIYRNRFLPFRVRIFFWYLFRRTNLDLTWFKVFSEYGNRILYNMRIFLHPPDLFFFENSLKFRSAKLKLPITEDPYVHLEAYQKPELTAQLYYLVSKEAYSFNYDILKLLKKYKVKFNSLLEFGCAIAPITTTIFEFFKLSKKTKIFISDIETIAFHYAAYKFQNCSNVIPILLVPENDFLLNLNEKVDLIFCITVFEHLNKPLETIKIFYNLLNEKGYLIFNFIIPNDPYDSQQAKNERDAVLDFIIENFEIIFGKIEKDKKVKMTIARKK